MPASRLHIRVRRPALAAFVSALVLVGYLGSYVSLHWLRGRGVVGNPQTRQIERTVFAPVMVYREHDLPGSRQLWAVCVHAFWWGRGQPMPELSRQVLDAYMQREDPTPPTRRR
jgi:hypothetical protein